MQLSFLTEFDENKHTIDHVARKYLEQASKSVQHLIPIKTSTDGNCLFHSIVSLISSPIVSAVEMRGLSYFSYASSILVFPKVKC